VRDSQRIMDDAVDRDGGADEEFVPPELEESQLGDGSHIHKCLDGRMTTLFKVEKKIGSPCDGKQRARRVRKRVHCLG
jgi:hypothetical protein